MTTLYIRNVDEELKKKFKALCVLRGKTLSEEIQKLMKEAVDKEGKKGTL